MERIGRGRRAGAGGRNRYELGFRLGPVEQPRHRVGNLRRRGELEGEPAETGERAVEGRRRPGRHARRVRHALFAKMLGREHDDHVHRQLGVLGDDLGLTGGDDSLGVVELEAQVHHVRRPDGLEGETRLGRTAQGGAQSLRKRSGHRTGMTASRRAGTSKREPVVSSIRGPTAAPATAPPINLSAERRSISLRGLLTVCRASPRQGSSREPRARTSLAGESHGVKEPGKALLTEWPVSRPSLATSGDQEAVRRSCLLDTTGGCRSITHPGEGRCGSLSAVCHKQVISCHCSLSPRPSGPRATTSWSRAGRTRPRSCRAGGWRFVPPVLSSRPGSVTLRARTRGVPGDGLEPSRVLSYFVPRLFGEIGMALMLDDLMGLCKEFEPSLLVFDPYAFAAPLVAAMTGTRAVHHSIGPLLDARRSRPGRRRGIPHLEGARTRRSSRRRCLLRAPRSPFVLPRWIGRRAGSTPPSLCAQLRCHWPNLRGFAPPSPTPRDRWST